MSLHESRADRRLKREFVEYLKERAEEAKLPPEMKEKIRRIPEDDSLVGQRKRQLFNLEEVVDDHAFADLLTMRALTSLYRWPLIVYCARLVDASLAEDIADAVLFSFRDQLSQLREVNIEHWLFQQAEKECQLIRGESDER